MLPWTRYACCNSCWKGRSKEGVASAEYKHPLLMNILEWTGIQNTEQLFRIVENREDLANAIANVKWASHGTQ